MQGVIFADSPGVYGMWHCFNCTARYTARELVACAGCGRPWPIAADVDSSVAALCTDCREQTEARGCRLRFTLPVCPGLRRDYRRFVDGVAVELVRQVDAPRPSWAAYERREYLGTVHTRTDSDGLWHV